MSRVLHQAKLLAQFIRSPERGNRSIQGYYFKHTVTGQTHFLLLFNYGDLDGQFIIITCIRKSCQSQKRHNCISCIIERNRYQQIINELTVLSIE